jgi:hypothetical protein
VGEVKEVCPLGVVELKRAGDRVEHRRRHPGQGAAFQLAVVLDADPGQRCDLAAAQTRHPAGTDDWQPRLLRGDFGTSRDQELADLGAIVHVNHRTAAWGRVGCLLSTPLIRHSHIDCERSSLVIVSSIGRRSWCVVS